jgi:hypothetical protein
VNWHQWFQVSEYNCTSSMSSFIFNFKEDILIGVLSKWSQILDIVRLDSSATCIHRDLFLSLIKDYRMCPVEVNYRPDKMISPYTWCLLREVKFRNVVLFGQDLARLLEIITQCNNCNYTKLTLVMLDQKHAVSLAVFIGSCCSQLTELAIEHCSINLYDIVKSDVWQALTKVSFVNFAKPIRVVEMNCILDALCKYCRRLLSLKLFALALNESSLIALIKSNPSLTEICVCGDGVNQSFVDFLIVNRENTISKLELFATGLLSVESLYQLLEKVVSVAASYVSFEFVDLLSKKHYFCFNLHKEDAFYGFFDDASENNWQSYGETCIDFDKPYLNCDGNFKLLLDRHILSPLALLTDLTHFSVAWKYIDNELLLSMLQANKKVTTLVVDVGDCQEYPNLLSVPFLIHHHSHHHKLKLIKIVGKGIPSVWIKLNVESE